MELKTARLTLLIDPHKKAAFDRLCALQDRTPSQVVRQLIRDYLALHEVRYAASGELGVASEPPAELARPEGRRSSSKPPRQPARRATKPRQG